MAFRSGKRGRFLVAESGIAAQRFVRIKRWTFEPKNQLLDVTHGNSGGFGEYIPGVSDADMSVEFDHYVGDAPFGIFIEGANLYQIVLGVDGASIPLDSSETYFLVTQAIIETVEETLEVRGLVSCTLRCKVQDGNWAVNEPGET